MSTKVVYVTGCLGFIGSHVTRACLQKGWYVMGVDKCTYAANLNVLTEFHEYDNFEFMNEDINASLRLLGVTRVREVQPRLYNLSCFGIAANWCACISQCGQTGESAPNQRNCESPACTN